MRILFVLFSFLGLATLAVIHLDINGMYVRSRFAPLMHTIHDLVTMEWMTVLDLHLTLEQKGVCIGFDELRRVLYYMREKNLIVIHDTSNRFLSEESPITGANWLRSVSANS